MPTKILKIPKSIEVSKYEVGAWVAKRIDKVKMTDITSTKQFEIYVASRSEIKVTHENTKQLNLFTAKLNKIFKGSVNKLKTAIK